MRAETSPGAFPCRSGLRGPCRALMVQGTASDVGKSLLVAGLCRAYARRGLTVLPFKPQNMSNNAAVSADGGEIGRAQALQAVAAGVPSTVDMNPVLLKPQSDTGAQVVVRGRVKTVLSARQYHTHRATLLPAVLDSFNRLKARADLVLVEGAGSPAEVNLRHGDIANMGFALAAKVAVVLLGDVERGGVIAALAGTRLLLSDAENALVRGCLVNKFRGDPTLFEEAQSLIESHTGWPFLGVVPYLEAARRLPKEDSASLDFSRIEGGHQMRAEGPGVHRPLMIAVLRLPRIANFDDLDPLSEEPDVNLLWVEAGDPLPAQADVVIVPGSKATMSDLRFVKKQGWDEDIRAHVRRGGYVIGLCAGYQMLGTKLSDPEGREGASGTETGIGLLEVDTLISGDKTLACVRGYDVHTGAHFDGYEMHLGLSDGPGRRHPWLRLSDGRNEGARAWEGRVVGAYVHGVFAADGFRHAFLAGVHENRRSGTRIALSAYRQNVERSLDRLAEHLERHLDLDRLFDLAKAFV